MYDQHTKMQQDGNDSTLQECSPNIPPQFKVPLTPPFNTFSNDYQEQSVKSSAVISKPAKGTERFKTQDTPFPEIMETPVPNISSRKAILNPKTQPVDDSKHIAQQIARYSDWLASQAKQRVLNDNIKVRNEYIQDAAKVVSVGRKKVEIFAPFQPERSALQTFTIQQIAAMCVLALLFIAGLALFRLQMLTAIITAVILLYSGNMILSFVTAIRSFSKSPEEHIADSVIHGLDDANWPPYTILCPLYREAGVVPQFVEAIQKLDYPIEKLQVFFLTEVDDIETRNAIRSLSLPSHFKIIIVPDGKPRTKPRACNFGLMQAEGDYVVIYDAEDIPDPLQLKKAVLTFANHGPNLACVQAKLNFYNPHQNILTRMFTLEYALWFDLILPGLQGMRFPLPLGGTSNHFRTTTLRALGGWDAFNVTEDCDLGLRLAHYKFVTQVLDSTTFEEANSQMKNWLRQRSRWIKGYMQTYLINMRNPLQYLRPSRFYEFF
jgi:hypothetical protein